MQLIVDKLNGVDGVPAGQRNAGRVNFMNNNGAQANLGAQDNRNQNLNRNAQGP